MQSEYYYYIILSILILTGVLMIAGPHFPDSDVSEGKNKDAFIALTVLGVFIIVPLMYWMIKIFKVNTWKDLATLRSLRRSDTFI
jgi:hypothetical protein